MLWENVPVLAGTGLYSLAPGFALALAVIVAVSLLDREPSKEVQDLFERAKAARIWTSQKPRERGAFPGLFLCFSAQ